MDEWKDGRMEGLKNGKWKDGMEEDNGIVEEWEVEGWKKILIGLIQG